MDFQFVGRLLTEAVRRSDPVPGDFGRGRSGGDPVAWCADAFSQSLRRLERAHLPMSGRLERLQIAFVFRGVLVRKSGKYAKESGRRDRHTPVGAAWSLESEVAFFTAENLSNSYLDDLDATR